MPDSAKHVIIASNPKSGSRSSRERVNRLRQAALGVGFTCDVVFDLAEVNRQAVEYVRQNQLRAVISAGGDGTVAALANLLPAEVPLLPFPLGTENLLAKHLGISGDLHQTCETLRNGALVTMDVGSANGRLFLVMLSCGFDAEVVKAMDAVRKGHITRWSYFRPIISTFSKYRFPQIPFIIDGDDAHPETAAWIFVFNLPRYAARLELCPQADPLDGYLDVCIFRRSGTLPGLRYLFRVYRGSHQSLTGFQHFRCKQLSIGIPAQIAAETRYQIDGDPGGVLPLSVEIVPQRLTLLQPSTSPLVP